MEVVRSTNLDLCEYFNHATLLSRVLTLCSLREELEIKTTAYDTFNHNIRMLNESMGLCLPAMTVRDPT
jgi:hypothetical protein